MRYRDLLPPVLVLSANAMPAPETLFARQETAAPSTTTQDESYSHTVEAYVPPSSTTYNPSASANAGDSGSDGTSLEVIIPVAVILGILFIIAIAVRPPFHFDNQMPS